MYNWYFENITVKPSPKTIINDKKPSTTPSICWIVFMYPKFFPDAVSIILFGPGVPDWTMQSIKSGIKYSIIIVY